MKKDKLRVTEAGWVRALLGCSDVSSKVTHFAVLKVLEPFILLWDVRFFSPCFLIELWLDAMWL